MNEGIGAKYNTMASAAQTFIPWCLLFLFATFQHVSSQSSPCASQPCENDGTCIEYPTAFQCRCKEEFTGLRCEISALISNSACDANPCAHGACASSAADRFTCMCPAEWRGTACDIDVNECLERDLNPCVNGTLCVNDNGGYHCEDPCTPNPCNNAGSCSVSSTSPNFVCECPPNFEGENCDIWVETDDACRSLNDTCKNGGTCFSFGGAPICFCSPGFQGEHCEIDTDVCHAITCQNGGHCVKTRDQRAVCVCPQFYNGSYCEIELSPCMNDPCNASSACIDDLTLPSGYRCMSPCTKDPCQNGGTCVNNQSIPHGYYCACSSDYQGTRCEYIIPPCSREPCLNGGTCESDTVDPAGYRCSCEAGFQGPTCELTIISPCVSNPCENGGTCEPLGGALAEFECNCQQGYSGDFCQVILHLCTFEGVTYQEGSMRNEECNTCHCQEGSWHCTDKFCGEFMVSFAFNQPNNFDDNNAFSNSLKKDIVSYFEIDADMIQVLTVSGDPSEVEFQLQDTVDSDVDLENVAADMLRQFVTGTYAFHYRQASYSINSRTVVIERHDGEVKDNGTEGSGQEFINITLIIVCVVVSTILVLAIIFGIAMIVVYKRRSRKEKIYSKKEKNTNASNNVIAGSSAIDFHKNVYNRVPSAEVPVEVTEIRLQNGARPADVNINMEARV